MFVFDRNVDEDLNTKGKLKYEIFYYAFAFKIIYVDRTSPGLLSDIFCSNSRVRLLGYEPWRTNLLKQDINEINSFK